MHARTPASVVLIAFTAVLPGCGRRAAPAARDSGFAEMQHRGAMAMGVDQYTSTHQFDILPGGGRIQLERDSDDSLGTAQIRAHLRLLLHAFQAEIGRAHV